MLADLHHYLLNFLLLFLIQVLPVGEVKILDCYC